MAIGKIIADLRTTRGYTQRELAEKLSVSNGTIGMWESEKRQPDITTIVKIASFFSVTTDYLLGVEEINSSENDELRNQPAGNDCIIANKTEEKFLCTFRNLNEDNQDIIIGKMKEMLKEQRYEDSVENGGLREAK